MIGFDQYDRRARLAPGLLATAPIAVLVVTLGLKKYPAVAAASGLVAGASGAYVLAVLVRHFGRRLEATLWASWDGRPTTRFLRLRDASANAVERGVWRDAVQRVTGITLLSAEAEGDDPTTADETIEAAVNQLLPLGQGATKYPLLHAENIQYGFERNLWGVRWVARALSVACTLALIVIFIVEPTSIAAAAVVAGVAIDLGFAIGWFVVPSANRVRLASERYARQLFHAVVSESRNLPESQTKGTSE